MSFIYLKPSPKAGKYTFAFLFITVFLDMIGIGIIMPAIPGLMLDVGATDLSNAARMGGFLTLAFAVANFIMSPILGNLSDRYGRRPVILISLFVYGLDFLVMSIAPTYAWLLIARLAAGAFAATVAVANAVIADISPPEQRAANFGVLGAAFGLGFIIGPALGGFLGEIDPRLPFKAAGCIILLACLFGFFALPETLSPEKRRPFTWARANPLASFAALARLPYVRELTCCYFLAQLAHTVFPSVWSFFTTEKFGWGEQDIGWSLAYYGLMAAFVQGYLVRKIVPKIGEEKAFLIGCFAMMFNMSAIALLVQNGYMLYILMNIGVLGGLMTPALQGLITQHTPQNQQGELQGGLASAQSLSMIIGPLAMTQTFAHFTQPETSLHLPGAPFLLAACFLLLCLWPFLAVCRKMHHHQRAKDL